MQHLNLNLCSQMRCFNSAAQFCLEIENWCLITRSGSGESALSDTSLSCFAQVLWELADARDTVFVSCFAQVLWGLLMPHNPVWGCTKLLRSWHQDGCKTLAAPCQIAADDPAYGSMPGSSWDTGMGIFQTGAVQQAGFSTVCAPSHFSCCQLCTWTGANPSVKSF